MNLLRPCLETCWLKIDRYTRRSLYISNKQFGQTEEEEEEMVYPTPTLGTQQHICSRTEGGLEGGKVVLCVWVMCSGLCNLSWIFFNAIKGICTRADSAHRYWAPSVLFSFMEIRTYIIFEFCPLYLIVHVRGKSTLLNFKL